MMAECYEMMTETDEMNAEYYEMTGGSDEIPSLTNYSPSVRFYITPPRQYNPLLFVLHYLK